MPKFSGTVSVEPLYLDTVNGYVGLATNTPLSHLDINKQGNVVGGNILLGLNTDAVTKYSSIATKQYSSVAEPEGFGLIGGVSNATDNLVSIGGFLNEINAATNIRFYTAAAPNTRSGTLRALFDSSGHFTPGTTNAYDLGSAALRWRNIYTQDLHLSNGIGDYTVVEGEEDLFLVNNKTGKSFKFALIEVDPSTVPPKSEG
jgi:hypothetical protein